MRERENKVKGREYEKEKEQCYYKLERKGKMKKAKLKETVKGEKIEWKIIKKMNAKQNTMKRKQKNKSEWKKKPEEREKHEKMFEWGEKV